MLSFDGFSVMRRTGLAGLAMAGALAFNVVAARADDAGEWIARSVGKSETGSYSGLGMSEAASDLGKSMTGGGGGVRWVAGSDCLDGQLQGVIASVAASYGSVTVSSTCRSKERNAAVGGAEHSYHLSGSAADFRVHGNWSGAYEYLKSNHGGGLKHMGGGLFHIDTGPRRPM